MFPAFRRVVLILVVWYALIFGIAYSWGNRIFGEGFFGPYKRLWLKVFGK